MGYGLWVSRRALLVVLALAGCGSEQTVSSVIDDTRGALSPAPIDCGDYHFDWASAENCPEELALELQCFLDAFDACEPAELYITYDTIDAGDLPSTWFVVPEEAGCRVTAFSDHSGDVWNGGADLTENHCESVEDVRESEPMACPALVISGCELVNEWDF